jgi:hypothetical protein
MTFTLILDNADASSEREFTDREEALTAWRWADRKVTAGELFSARLKDGDKTIRYCEREDES